MSQNLSIPGRLALLCLLFYAPILLAGTLLVQQHWADISFVRQEVAGAAHLRSFWPTFTAVIPGGGDSAELARAESDFGATSAAAAFRRALDRQERLVAGAGLISAVADGSNLTLDPDPDSFYVQDAVTMRLPDLLVAANGLPGAAADSTSDRAAVLAVAASAVAAAATGVERSLTTAIRNNPDGATRRSLAARAAALKVAVARLTAMSAAARRDPAVDLEPSLAQVPVAVDQTWRASATELDRLLKARQHRLLTELVADLALCLVAASLATAVAVAVARGLSRRLHAQVAAMERLAANDTGVDIPFLDDRHETGRIAQALESFKASLQDRGRLQGEAAREHARSEDRLREAETAFRAAGEGQTRAVQALSRALARLARGDLTVSLDEAVGDDYAALKADFNAAVATLAEALAAVRATAGGIGTGVDEIARASDDLARRTEQQAASLEQTAAALDQITAAVKKTAAGAQQTSETVGAARGEAMRSGEVVTRAVQAMGEIEQSSNKVNQILGVIDEIAFQTNLLALNAGVEAARAGDAGRGFAVVAQEVRSLAQRSAQAAKEIKALISASTLQVNQGVELVGATGAALDSIVARVADIDALVVEIAVSAQQQAAGLTQVNTAVTQMDRVVQQNAAMVEETTAATHNLRSDVGDLTNLIARFTLNKRPQRYDRRAASAA